MPPFRGDASLRYDALSEAFFVEAIAHVVTGQNRVAETRGEQPTDGYLTADLKGGVRPYQGMEFRFGVLNLTDEYYLNHLNARNPFNGTPIPEPGLMVFADASYAF